MRRYFFHASSERKNTTEFRQDADDDDSREESPSIEERNEREVERQASPEPPIQSNADASAVDDEDKPAEVAEKQIEQDDDSETDPDS